MNVFAVCGFGICAAVIAAVMRQTDDRFSPLIAASSAVVMLGYIAVNTVPAFDYLRSLVRESGAESYFALSLKALGISLVCQFASEICRDLDESTVGGRIELAGKTAIILISLPLVGRLIDFAKGLL